MERLTLETERLRLTAMTAEALGAWIEEDVHALRRETGAAFEAPVRTPPLFGEDLPTFRDGMRQAPDELGWWVWLVSTRDDARPVGVCGLGGVPVNGSVTLGYSVFPEEEGQGFATEASAGLVRWVLGQAQVERVRATVPTWNLASVAVARKLGMVEVGHEISDEVGEVAVYELRNA